MGAGKTVGALALAKKAGVRTLIICPKALKGKWEKEGLEWLGDTAIVMTKEEFKRDAPKVPACGAVIIDEAHKEFANHKTQSHKMLVKYIKAREPRYIWALTGTPYTSSPWSIYGIAKILGHEWNWIDFRQKYFQEKHLGRRVVFIPRVGIEDEIAALVQSIGSVVRLDECIDVPEQTFIEKRFPLTKEQKNAIKEMTEIEENPLTRFGKAHQIANGILIGNEYEDTKTFPCLKNDFFIKICEENDKVVGFSKYNAHLDLLAAELSKRDIPYRIIRGDTSHILSEIEEEGDKAHRMVILGQIACSSGYQLPSFPIVVHICNGYSFVDYDQSCGRVLRIDRPKPNLYITLTTSGSMDLPVLAARDAKMSFSEAIFTKNNPSVFN